MTFKLGRLPEDTSKPRLTLAPHLRATAPPPVSADWYSRVQAWGMLANDSWGDCVFAGNGHIIEQQTALGEGDEIIVTDQEALLEYSLVTGFDPNAGPPGENPTDQGALIQDGLADLRKNGLAGQKIAAFARVNQADMGEVKTALAELGAVSFGVNLPQSAMDQFNAGQPWSVVSDDGGILGGHCVTGFGYDDGSVYLVSWGRVVPTTWDWLVKYCDEAWAVVSSMWAGENGKDPAGVDLAGLGAEFAALTGDPSPFPAPQPPQPTPPAPPQPTPPQPTPPAPQPPGPGPDPAVLLEQLAALIRKTANAALQWLEAHHL